MQLSKLHVFMPHYASQEAICAAVLNGLHIVISAVYTYYWLINFCLSVHEIAPGDFASLAYVNHALRLVPTSIHCINNTIIIEIIYMTVSYNIQVLQHVQYMMLMHGY